MDLVMGLSEHCKTKSLGRWVGEEINRVLEVDIFSMKNREDRILKLKILLDLTTPLQRTLKIANNNNKVIDLQLKYERIGNFYHYSVCVGHEIRICNDYLNGG
ncbi:hypothetical protein AAHE18_05G106400 [Arachis hypogaea]